MAKNLMNSTIVEGHSLKRPPYFDGRDYTYWKERMKVFVQSTDYKLWLVIKNGPNIPKKVVNGKEVEKLEEEFNDQDMKKMEQNAKAMNILYCGLNPDDCWKISRCQTAKQMWDKLPVTYEDTLQVKEAKINMLVHEYELFHMEEEENVEEMFKRFSSIIDRLKFLGKVYPDRDLLDKILGSLTLEWEPKVTATIAGPHYNSMSYDDLRGRLIAHELTFLNRFGDDENREKKLKATTSSYQEKKYDGGAHMSREEEIALLVKRLYDLAKKKSQR